MGKPEEWREVPGFEGLYAVSDRGRVMREGGRRGASGGYILRPTETRKGYLRVELNDRDLRAPVYVQGLVLTAFRGPRPEGSEARHLNGDRHNNCLSNLAWGTPAQNTLDKLGDGRGYGDEWYDEDGEAPF